MALTIYGVARSRAIRVLWMAEEAGTTYTHVQVHYADGGTQTPDYLAINPNGQIPAIRDGDLVMYESLAINLYLAKRYGGALGPQSTAEDGLMMQWTLWAATELEPHTLKVMFNTVYPDPSKRDPAVLKAALEALKKPLAVLDAHLGANGGFLVDGRFTVADLNAICIVWYMRGAEDALKPYPAIRAWRDAALARPAARKAFALRGD